MQSPGDGHQVTKSMAPFLPSSWDSLGHPSHPNCRPNLSQILSPLSQSLSDPVAGASVRAAAGDQVVPSLTTKQTPSPNGSLAVAAPAVVVRPAEEMSPWTLPSLPGAANPGVSSPPHLSFPSSGSLCWVPFFPWMDASLHHPAPSPPWIC